MAIGPLGVTGRVTEREFADVRFQIVRLPRPERALNAHDHLENAAPDFPLALGVERAELVALAHPWLAGALAVILMIGAAFGVTRLKVDEYAQPIISLGRSRIPAV